MAESVPLTNVASIARQLRRRANFSLIEDEEF